MLRILEKLIWGLQVVAIIAFIIFVIWAFVEFRTLPLWLPVSVGVFELLFALYAFIKKRREE